MEGSRAGSWCGPLEKKKEEGNMAWDAEAMRFLGLGVLGLNRRIHAARVGANPTFSFANMFASGFLLFCQYA